MSSASTVDEGERAADARRAPAPPLARPQTVLPLPDWARLDRWWRRPAGRAAFTRVGPAGRRWGRVTRAVVAVAFTLALVQFSLRHGRLSLFPIYDDVGYLADGASRLQLAYDRGPVALVRDFRKHPPHSPWSTYEASASFLLLGMHDWAPYAGNAVLVFGFLTLAAWAGRGLQGWHRACLAVFLLAAPLTGHAVTDCRPDVAAALLTTAGAFVLLGRPLVHARPRHKVASGVLFGLALLAKPSVFPATLFVAGNAFLAAAAADRFGRGARFSFGQLVAAWLWCVVPLSLVAAPYYAVGGRQTVHYVWGNTFGAEAGVWKARLPPAEHLNFYVGGPAGREMLGPVDQPAHAWLLAAALAAAGGFYLVRWVRVLGKRGPGRRREWVGVAAFAWVVLAAYAVCTINQMKHVFLGLGFQVPLVFLAVLGLRNMVLSQRLRGQPPWAEALLVGLSVAAVVWFRWPGPPETRHPPASARNMRAVVEGVYQAVRARSDGPGGPDAADGPKRPRVLLTMSGDLSLAVLGYWSTVRREPAVYFDPGVTTSAGLVIQLFDGADFVVACDPGINDGLAPADMGLVAPFVPSTKFQGPILAALQDRPDFARVATIEYPPNHKHFYVYQRVGPPAATTTRPVPATRPAEVGP